MKRNGVLFWIAASYRALGCYWNATDLIGDAISEEASIVIVPAGRAEPDFWLLCTGMAGEFIQNIVACRLQLAIVGDISALTEASEPLRDVVRGCKRGASVWFLPDLEAVVARMV